LIPLLPFKNALRSVRSTPWRFAKAALLPSRLTAALTKSATSSSLSTKRSSAFHIWARLARLVCLLDFRDSYGLIDHLSSDGFDYWSGGLVGFPRNLLHIAACDLGRCEPRRGRAWHD